MVEDARRFWIREREISRSACVTCLVVDTRLREVSLSRARSVESALSFISPSRHCAISIDIAPSRHLKKRSTIAHGRSLTVCRMRMFVRPLDARHHNENHAAQPQAPRTTCAAADPAPIVSLLLVDKPLVPACVPLRAPSRQLAQSHEAANRATHESDAWRIWAGRSRKVARRVEGRPRGDAMRYAALQGRAWMGRRGRTRAARNEGPTNTHAE